MKKWMSNRLVRQCGVPGTGVLSANMLGGGGFRGQGLILPRGPIGGNARKDKFKLRIKDIIRDVIGSTTSYG